MQGTYNIIMQPALLDVVPFCEVAFDHASDLPTKVTPLSPSYTIVVPEAL